MKWADDVVHSAFNPDAPPRRDRPTDCELCGGTGWASVPDPLFNGAMVDCRCPACCDLSVRATKTMWEMRDGRKVGPR